MLSYKFDEIIESLRVNIRWKNTKKIMETIKQHLKTTQLLNELGEFYSRIIGIIYLNIPYILSFTVKPLLIPGFDPFLKVIMVTIFVSALLTTYLINFLVAAITVRNRDAPKYLYPNFILINKMTISTKLKIEAYLERLITEFIGIHCFNMFEFTKLSFYQYFVTITSVYFLVFK